MLDRTTVRRLARQALTAATRAAATAAGEGIVTLTIWWITNH